MSDGKFSIQQDFTLHDHVPCKRSSCLSIHLHTAMEQIAMALCRQHVHKHMILDSKASKHGIYHRGLRALYAV